MENYTQIAEVLKNADAILVGASNGFSISEGLHIFADNEAFEELLGDFREKYGIRSILQGGFIEFPSEEEKWAYASRLYAHYSGHYAGSDKTEALKKIIGDKPYFMVTSNGENHFELAGFAPANIYEIEGSWKEMQCAKPCCKELYPASDLLMEMADAEQNGKIPSEFVPKCPHCGGTMMLHTAVSNAFIPDIDGQNRFQTFLERWHNKKLVVQELGIGWRNQMIKGPFMRLVEQEADAIYITVNKGEIYILDEIKEKSFGLDGDISGILNGLAKEMTKSQMTHAKKQKDNGGFQNMLGAAKERLKDRSAEEIAMRCNIQYQADTSIFCVQSLNEVIEVSFPSYEIKQPIDEWHHLMLLHYLDLADEAKVSPEFIPFGKLKDGVIRGTKFDQSSARELEGLLEDKTLEQMKTMLEKMGGRFIDTTADLTMDLYLFPKYPLRLNIWLADDEFPVSARMLVNEHADHYLTVEDAVTAGELILRKFLLYLN